MIILCILILVLAGKSSSVCLKGTIEKGFLDLHCKVDLLIANVEIYGPDKNLYGSCFGPTRLSDRHVVCDQERNITQNLTTNVTTVVTRESSSFSIYGQWICKHGTGLGNDTLNVTRTILADDCVCDVIPTLVTVICGIILLEALGYVLYKRRIKWRRNEKMDENGLPDEEQLLVNEEKPLFVATNRRNGGGEETFSLLQDTDEILKHSLCMTCQHLTAFAFCPVCGGFYCESCFEQHNVISDHTLIQIEHIPGIDHSTKCNTCDTLSTRVCITCEKLFCDSCSCNHEHKSLLLKSAVANQDSTERNFTVGVGMTELYKVNLSKNNSHQHSDSEPIPDSTASEHCDLTKKSDDNKSEGILHVRVFGFAFLSSDRFVVGDSHNRTLKVFQKNSLNFSFSLEKEPRGLTALYGDKVAVTFPHLRLIKKYDITETCILDSERDINLQDTGKPFSIAYNQDVFAVEINESEDGFIAILSFEGEVLYKIREATKYAYFTGHTLRLALDKISESVFITAMSKRSVTCLDFSGKKKWSKQIPSPRGVCFIPPRKLLVASKRGNAIYNVNSKTGDNNIIAAMGCIQSPRYITYDQNKQMLYVHVFDENDDNYIVVIKYNTQ